MVFSLGNSFQAVPLDRVIALDVLLQPLRLNPVAGVGAVVQYLLTESNHPPLYCVLVHWWMQVFAPLLNSSVNEGMEGYVSVWAARSLPALFGAASIPAIYGLSQLAFRSRLVSQLAAAMMAVSPYAIFLAQEARHYTLAILWVIASLSCLVIATRHIYHRTSLPLWLSGTWIGINALGIATHYFFSLSLCAEALVLTGFLISGSKVAINPIQIQNLKSLCAVAVGTLIGGLVWLPVFWQNSYNTQLTQWIQSDEQVGLLAWVSPVFQALAGWIGMLCLLPVEASALPVVIASGSMMLIFFIWAVPILNRGIKTQLQQLDSRIATQLFLGVVCSAITIFLIFTYGFGIDLTRGARYNFVYFPAVIVLVGASLAACWNSSTPHSSKQTGKASVVLIWLMGLVSAITVVCNLGYQKYYRPDL